MSIQLTKLTEDLNIISALADQPTITSTQLKAKFDEASGIIKDYINNTLIDDVEDALNDMADDLQEAIETIQGLLDALTAENITYDNTTSGLTATNVQDAIDELKSGLNTLSSQINGVATETNKRTHYTDFDSSTGGVNPTIAPLQDYTGTITMTKSGYYPLAVAGFHFSRTYADMQLLRLEITSKADGRVVVTYRILNADNERTLTPNLYVNVLWVRIRS